MQTFPAPFNKTVRRTSSAMLVSSLWCANVAAQPPREAPTITIVRMAPAAVATAEELTTQAEGKRRAARVRAQAWTIEARRALDQGRLADAADRLHSALITEPDDREVAMLLGGIYVRLHRFLEAVPTLQHALHLGADPAVAAPLLAYALRQAGDRSAADAVLAAHELSKIDEKEGRAPHARADSIP